MTEETGAPAGGEAIATAPAAIPAELSIDEAVRFYTQPKKPESTAESAEPATADPEPAQADSDPETDPAEPTEEAEPEEKLPPIEPPRSWTQAEKERFQSLPRETQEYLHTREQERDRDFRTRQNELAEQRKAVQAERDAAAQAKQQYEAQLPALMKELESVNQAQFSDIKSMEDVVKLQAEDPFRFQAWQVHQMRLQAAKAETDKAESQKAQERQNKRASYEQEQNKLLIELVPEMADPKKAGELRERAVSMLNDDLGLKTDQLSRWMQDDTGHEILSNAGIQRLIADGLKYRDILKAPKAVAAKPVPPVQKPGAAAPKGSQASERVQALQKTFERDPSVENATALRLARLKRA